MIDEHVSSFYGLTVEEFDPEKGITDVDKAYRISLDWDQNDQGIEFSDILSKFLESPKVSEIKAFIAGAWCFASETDSGESVIEPLVAAREQFSSLEALFIGDIICEENEVSWIQQSDMSPLWQAFPNLVHFRVRGMDGLSLGTLRSDKLKTLIVETGGLPSNVLDQVCRADLPNLEHLELWLGDDGYGWESSPEDLQPILSGSLFPNLKYLGLRDSCVADEVAKVVANAPILERIETLDLSLGTLGDEGAEALAASALVAKLQKLDLHHNYISKDGVAKLAALGIDLDASEQQEPDEYDGETYRYVAVSE